MYNIVGGESYEYDIVERMTYDLTCGLYKAYDYVGRLIVESTADNFSAPERRYRCDVRSRLRVEETNYKASYHNEMTMFSCYAPNDPSGSGSCGGEQPEMSPMEHKFADSNDDTMWAIDYIIGVVAFGNGSAYTDRWDQVVGLTMTGGNDGKNGILIENLTEGDNDPDFAVSTVRHENMQVSPLGMTDEDGFRTQENLNSGYGVPYQKLILWDGSADDHFDNVATNESTLELDLTPASGVAQPITADMIGAIARIANPDEAPYVLHGFVVGVDTGNGIFYIDDPTGDLYALLTATDNAMLTVFDNHDTGINEEAVHTAGTWGEEDITFSEESGGVTIFTTSSAFPTYAVGWTLQPNANKPIFFPIVGITSSTITVLGDLTGVASAGDQYFILHPPGIDKTNGAVNTNATEQTTRFLAFGYQYITPMAGVHTGSTIEGRQGGNNLAGQYQVWNRNYLPDIGRWTTPDPAMSPWSNLMDYAAGSPQRVSDPTGLRALPDAIENGLREVEKELIDDAEARLNEVYKELNKERNELDPDDYAGNTKKYLEAYDEWKEEVEEIKQYIEEIRKHWTNAYILRLGGLGACPCENPDKGGVKNDDGWARDDSPGKYHPKAEVCFRSYSKGYGAGQQCCYDDNGKLITGGPSAGTPDLHRTARGENEDGSVYYGLLDPKCWGPIRDHIKWDVDPWKRLGWERYNKIWIPDNSNNCKENIK